MWPRLILWRSRTSPMSLESTMASLIRAYVEMARQADTVDNQQAGRCNGHWEHIGMHVASESRHAGRGTKALAAPIT